MKRKTKRIFLVIISIFFLITAFSVISYSFGWRIDWRTGKITQPGAFYFKVYPKSADIYINGKLKKKTDFFFGSALIDNMMPNKYIVKIEKSGFFPWEKTLEIKKSKVTDAKMVTLIPKNPKEKFISGNIEKMFFSPDKKKIIFKEDETAIRNKGNDIASFWSLKLFNIKENLKSQLFNEEEIAFKVANCPNWPKFKKEIKLENLKFSPDSNNIILKVSSITPCGEKGEKPYFYYFFIDLKESPLKLTFLPLLGKEKISHIYFNPKNEKSLFILTKGEKTNFSNSGEQLKKFNLADKKILTTNLKNIIALKITREKIYYLDSSGFLYQTDTFLKNALKLNEKPLPIFKNEEISLDVSHNNIALKGNNHLYFFSNNSKSFQEISGDCRQFRFSPDSKKIAYSDGHSIWILYLKRQYAQPEKFPGEKTFLTRFSEEINNIFWYNSSYLLFQVGKQIKIAEIDDRDRINIIDLPNNYPEKEKSFLKTEKNIFWDDLNSCLYVLTEKGTLFLEKLLL